MTVGPVEYMLLSYGDNGLGDGVVSELGKLVDDGKIRILDLALVSKDDDDTVTLGDYDESAGMAEFAVLNAEIGGLISQEDADYLGETLEPGSSAVLIMWEDPWAAPLFDALRDAGVELVEGGHVPDDLAVAAVEAVASFS